MIKRNKTFLLHALFVLALMFAAVPASAEEDEFDNGDFEGSFGLFTEGTATIVNTNNEVATSENFTCTYTVNPDGTGTAECVIDDFCQSIEKYAFVIVQDGEEIHFMMTSVVYGTGPPNCLPAEPFVRAILRKQGE